MQDKVILPQYRGLRTSIDPSVVPEGFLTTAQNIRIDSGIPEIRAGSTLVSDTAFSSENCVGAGFFQSGSNVYYLFAIDDGLNAANSVEVYWNIYNGSTWGTFATTNKALNNTKYGDNRMYAPSDGYVTFTGVPGRTGTRYVVIQNGRDEPRIVDLSQLASGSPPATGAMVFNSISALTQGGSISPEFGIEDFLDVTASTPTHTETDANFAWADTGSPKYWTLTTSGAIAAGETALIHAASATVDLRNSDQIWLIYSGWAGDRVLTSKLKWEIRDNNGSPGFHTIHDPANGLDGAFTVNLKDGYKILSFPVAHLNENASSVEMDEITGFRVTASQPLDAGDLSGGGLLLYAVVASGRVAGGSQYQISQYHSGADYESPSVVLPNPVEGAGLRSLFGTTDVNLFSDTKLPIDPLLHYSVKVPTFAPTSTDRDRGVDYVRIYRKEPEEGEFYYVDQVQTAGYSSGWSYQSPYSAAGELKTYTDQVPYWAKNSTIIAPGAFVEEPPIGQACEFFAGRLAVGLTTASPKIKLSDRDYPFRFRSLAIGADEPGFESVLDSDSNVTAIVGGSASVIGGGFIYVFTKRNLYQVSDVYVNKIASLGTQSSESVAIDNNRLYFVDQDLQVRVLAGGIEHLSRYSVDNKILEGTNLVRWDGKLYARNSTTSTLIYSDGISDWVSEDTNSLNPLKFMRWDYLGESKLFFVSTKGKLYQYESGATDAGTEITMTLETPEYHTPGYEQIRAVGTQVVCDTQTGETLTTTLTSKFPAVTSTGTIDLDEAGDTVWRKDNASGLDTGVRGCSIKAKITGTLEYPFKLYSWKIKTDVGGRGRDS